MDVSAPAPTERWPDVEGEAEGATRARERDRVEGAASPLLALSPARRTWQARTAGRDSDRARAAGFHLGDRCACRARLQATAARRQEARHVRPRRTRSARGSGRAARGGETSCAYQ